jgi:phosphate transport system substrate-binding protein
MRRGRFRLRGRKRLLLALIAAINAPTTAATAAITGSAPSVLSRLAPAWIADFTRLHPDIAVTLRQPFGPPQGRLDPNLQSFLDGHIAFALLSRELADADRAAFRRAHGVDPVVIPVAAGAWNSFGYVDPVVVIVNAANPTISLSLRQLRAIFADGRAPIPDWGIDAWKGQPIHIAGGDAWSGEASARALTVRRIVLRDRRFRAIPDSGGEDTAVGRVAADPLAIAFTGLGHLGPGVKPIAIRLRDDSPPIPPTRANILDGVYPLARTVDLLLVPGVRGCVDREAALFATYLLSDAGQAVVARTGPFAPLPTRARAAARSRLRICS